MPVLARQNADLAQIIWLSGYQLFIKKRVINQCPATVLVSIDVCETINIFSVTMTTLSTALGLGVMPLLLYIYSTGFSEDELQVPFQTIGKLFNCLVKLWLVCSVFLFVA